LSSGRNGPRTYVAIFPDGGWIACVGSLGEQHPGLPVVTRDNTGGIRAFRSTYFGRLWPKGDTLEKAYDKLSSFGEEVPLDR
jgi:hypothetical protein